MGRLLITKDEDEALPLTVLQIIDGTRRGGAREIVQELWGAGYTITRRRGGDPFDVPKEIIPRGMGYQWVARATLTDPEGSRWQPVPSSRHDGLFAPVGYGGDIEVGGMVLAEMPKAQVDEAHAANIAKAHRNVDDWIEKYSGQFSGGVRVWTGDPNGPPSTFRPVGDPETGRVVIAQSPALVVPKAEPAPTSAADVTSAPKPQQSWLRRLLNLISTEH